MLPVNVLLEAATEVTTETTAQIEETTGFVQDPAKTVEKASKIITEFNKILPTIINFGINLLIALIIFIVGRFFIKFLLKVTRRFLERTRLEVTVLRFLISLERAICYVILVMIMLETVGIKTTSFLALLTTTGLAAGLALQGSLSNFAGGVLILIIKPFKVGDYIECVDMEGTVEKIDLFYTSLISYDNRLKVIPNGILSNNTICNWTAFDIRRVDFKFGVSYNTDITKARKAIESAASKCEKLFKDKPIKTFVSSLDESQVTLGLFVWAKCDNYWDVKFEINESVKNKLDEEGIEIPFNQIVVHNVKDGE
ncbi:MAG: mechanosensitive ion channel family protein [Lachnospiraceae bacterium]|nr:mechanosensitive ion channel family protein [Lachnospiraceae bacterium]